MNLFKTLEGILKTNDDITIVVRKSDSGKLVTSTNYKNNDVNDKAKQIIAPFIVTGTAEELDEHYAELIAKPMEDSSGIQTSMQNFEASKKEAQAASQAETQKKIAANNAKKGITTLLTKAAELLKDKKYKEAEKIYSEAFEKADTLGMETEKKKARAGIDKCKSNNGPDMFAAFEEESEEPETGNKEETGDAEETSDEQEADDADKGMDPLNFGD